MKFIRNQGQIATAHIVSILAFIGSASGLNLSEYNLDCCEGPNCRRRVILLEGTLSPTSSPSASPTASPTATPTESPSTNPVASPTESPSSGPTSAPSTSPTASPTENPSSGPTSSPSTSPTASPTGNPSSGPTSSPSTSPTASPTENPSSGPTSSPSISPTESPESSTTITPTTTPTVSPEQSSTCPEGWNLLRTFNLFTSGYLSSNSDVEGSVFAGGNLISSAAVTFGAHLSSTTQTTFSIAGDIVGGNAVNVIRGSMAYKEGLSASENADGSWVISGRKFEIQDPDTSNTAQADPDIETTASTYSSQLSELSNFLANLDDTLNDSVQIPGSQPGPFKFVVNGGGDHGIAVFHVDDVDLFENSKVQQIEFQINSTPNLVIINVAGTVVNWTHGNMVGSWLTGDEGRSKTVWNFYEAGIVDLKSRGLGGAIVAPEATLTIQNPIDGAVAVKNLKATSEVHFPLLAMDCPY